MASTTLSIRTAREEDAGHLADAERRIATRPGRLASRPEELVDEAFRALIVELEQRDNGIYLVAEQGGEIIAHAFLRPLGLASTSHVVSLTIAVHEGHQGQGIGRRLMTELLDWARSHPAVEKVELQVRSGNQPAINLYQHLGFVEEGRKTRRLKLGSGQYLDDIYMALWVGTGS